MTTPSSCILLTLLLVLNQSLTCQPSSSPYCRIAIILDTLKNELKPPFTANITKGILLHAEKDGEHFCEENLHNENGEHICVENFHGDISTNTTSTILGVVIQNPQETQHLCYPEVCMSSVGPEHHPSKIYGSLTGKHIKYYNAGQVSQHTSLLDGNHHMSTFPLYLASMHGLDKASIL